jgi:hypothetical protein
LAPVANIETAQQLLLVVVVLAASALSEWVAKAGAIRVYLLDQVEQLRYSSQVVAADLLPDIHQAVLLVAVAPWVQVTLGQVSQVTGRCLVQVELRPQVELPRRRPTRGNSLEVVPVQRCQAQSFWVGVVVARLWKTLKVAVAAVVATTAVVADATSAT